MKHNTPILFLILLLIICAPVLAESTQSTNKIFLNPFYRAGTTANTNYSYTLSLHPPDKINSIKSAIISFDMWMTPTVNFNAFVNGQSCNNPTYTISTTYSGAGRAIATFDCSNVITKEGEYAIILRADKNTGTVTAWIDVTYLNKPFGKIEVAGTEYSVGDLATNFVQLQDSQGVPVNNGSCFLDIWYPLTNGTHPYITQDAPMISATGDDGIYYYDMIVPSILGVYMLSAKCSYVYEPIWIYQENENSVYPIRSIITGSWQGTSAVLNAKSDGLYERCDGTIAQPCAANYTFNVTKYGIVDNISSINVYYTGQSDTNNRILILSYWNGSSFVNMTNTLTFSGTGGTTPTPYDELLTNNIPSTAIINNTVTLRLNVAGSERIFNNWLSLLLLSSVGVIQEVKGSSEMHVTNISGSAGIVAASAVWNYPTRNLTFYPTTDLSGINNSINALSTKIDSLNSTIVARLDNLTQQIANTQNNIVTKIDALNNITNATYWNTLTLFNVTNTTLTNTNTLIIAGTQLQSGMNNLLNDTNTLKNITNITYQQTITLSLGQSQINQSVNALLTQNAFLINLTNTTLQNTFLTLQQISILNTTMNNLLAQQYVLEEIQNSTLANTVSLLNLSSYIVNLTIENTNAVNGLYNLTNMTYQNTLSLLSVTNSIKNDTTTIINMLITLQSDVNVLQNDVSSVQSTVNAIDARTIDIQNSLSEVQGNLTMIISNINSLSANVSSINIQLTYIANDVKAILGNISGEENLSNITLQLDNITITLANVMQNLSVIYEQVALVNSNITAQNLSAINESLTGLIIAETGKPLTFDSSVVFLIIYILLLIVSMFVNSGGMYVTTGIYGIIYGLMVIPGIGFWFGLIAMAVGFIFGGIGIKKMW